MKKKFLLSVLMPMSFASAAEWQPAYTFFGLGLVNTEQLLSQENMDFRTEFVPQIALGVGKEYRLDEDWILDSNLSVNWTQARFQFEHEQVSLLGTLENTGLWTTTRLIRKNWIDNMSPFIEFGLGMVRDNYDDFNDQENDWRGASKAALGVEFTLSDSASFSIALGKTSYENH